MTTECRTRAWTTTVHPPRTADEPRVTLDVRRREMNAILGIPIYKKMTDADLIERTRKNLKWFRRVAWIHLVVVAGFSILIPKFFSFITDFIGDMPNEDFRKWAWSGLLFGLVMGTALALYVYKAAQAIVMGFDLLQVNRKDKLLVKYHDLLAEVAKERLSCEQQGGGYSPPAVRSSKPTP